MQLIRLFLEYQDAFALFDKKGDGKISCSQVGEVLRALGLSPLLSEIKKLEKEIDESGRFLTSSNFSILGHLNDEILLQQKNTTIHIYCVLCILQDKPT